MAGPPRRTSFVVKHLAGHGRIEAAIYAHLAGLTPIGTPRLLGVEHADSSIYLFLEYVRPAQSWPWRDAAHTALVLKLLAHLHSETVQAPPQEMVGWEYEVALRRSALETLDTVERAGVESDMMWLRPARRIVCKAVTNLTAMRAALLQAPTFGTTLLHGDVHTGNVCLRARCDGPEAVLLD
jgi:hypothetical protein